MSASVNDDLRASAMFFCLARPLPRLLLLASSGPLVREGCVESELLANFGRLAVAVFGHSDPGCDGAMALRGNGVQVMSMSMWMISASLGVLGRVE